MARCRSFVRENASTFADRERACQEEEEKRRQEREAEELEEAEQRAYEAELLHGPCTGGAKYAKYTKYIKYTKHKI